MVESEILALRMRVDRLGVSLVWVCAVLVVGPLWLLHPAGRTWALACGTEAASVVLAAAAVRLPWRDLPAPALLAFPVLALVPLAIIGSVGQEPATAFNGIFTLAVTYVGLTQRRRVALSTVVSMVPFYLLSNNGVSQPILARLPLAVTSWALLAVLLSDLVSRQTAAGRILKARAATDALTGLLNRQVLPDVLRQVTADDAVAMLDLDQFKRLNDTEGHQAGDEVLAAFGRTVKAVAREGDITIRYGGEEVLMVFPGTSLDGALRLLDRLTMAWMAERADVTFSAGVAVGEPGEPASVTLQRADDALYEAKRAGRNRVVAAGAAPDRLGEL